VRRAGADGHAPLYTAAYDLVVWVLGHLNERHDSLSADTCRLALRLLDYIVLALKDRERLEVLDLADVTLLKLRQRLRLAPTQGLLDERQALHGLGRCDDIGRQIGGWLRRLEAAE
jgi:hypothetical protein